MTKLTNTACRIVLQPVLVMLIICQCLTACMGLSSSAPESSDNQQVVGRGEGKDQWWNALPREAWSAYRKIPQQQAWFEVYQIFDGVFAIYEPGQFEEIISYLILGTERAMLFDTGIGVGNIRAVVESLTSLPVTVLNSHSHYDHVGGNHQFETILATNTEYTKKNAAGRAHREVAEFVGNGWVWKPFPDGFDPASYRGAPFVISREIDDGEIIELGGRRLEILLTPGHAPDSLCLLDRDNRLLFMGDTFYPASLYAHLGGSSFAEYQRSANRLADLQDQVDHLLPAHNEPVLSSVFLPALRDAFSTVQQPGTPYVLTDGNREYSFERFSLIVPDPPPWAH